MTKISSIVILGLLLTACTESEKVSTETEDPNQASQGKPETKKESKTINDIDLEHTATEGKFETFDYSNLTAWGGLRLKYFDGDLLIIEATHTGEFGSSKRIFYLKNDRIDKVEYIGHHADWDKYYEKYPLDEYPENPEKLTYSDTSFVVKSSNSDDKEYHQKLMKEGKSLLEFIRSKNWL